MAARSAARESEELEVDADVVIWKGKSKYTRPTDHYTY
jgi:hypothetical protein